jgi:hypothetical protein
LTFAISLSANTADPLSIWVELNLGIELPDNEPPSRAKPMTIQAASEKLAKDADPQQLALASRLG